MHISENRLEGSLLDTDLKEVLDECHAHLVTGTLSIDASGKKAILEIRAGAVDSVEYQGLKRTEALAKLHELKDGEFELTQKLPNLTGELGTAASLEANSDEISLVKLMQLCEDNALSCSVTVKTDDVDASILYKAGEIDDVTWNGESDTDKIVDVVKLENAKIRVAAPPLKFGILSWPTVRDDPTPAFIPIQEMAEGRLDAKAEKVARAEKGAKAKGKKKLASGSGAKSAPDKSPTKLERPVPEESSGAAVLLGLVVGLVVIAAVLVFAVKFLTS